MHYHVHRVTNCRKEIQVLKAIMGIALLTLGGAMAAQAAPDFSRGPDHDRPSPTHSRHAVPEIDPASAMSGLTLLLGGLTVLRGRSQKKK
jgi:hypothetical protein